ncbi:MAG: glucosamine inositolphosphorylceramide transferase family protein [Rhizobiaceae bacterium]
MTEHTRDRRLPAIEIIVPKAGARLWQKIVVERLREAGHDIAVVHGPDDKLPLAMRAAGELERRLFRRHGPGMMSPVRVAESSTVGRAGLRLDLTGVAPDHGSRTLRLAFDGSFSDSAVLAATAAGRLPDIEAVLDGEVVARAAPMIDKRESAMLGAEDVLARAITLVVAVVGKMADGMREASTAGPSAISAAHRNLANNPHSVRFADTSPPQPWGRGREPGGAASASSPPSSGGEVVREANRSGGRASHREKHGNAGFLRSYAFSALPRLGKEALRRFRYRHAHWRVGYRFTDGPGVAEKGELGSGWRQIPDDGTHFYADPFPFEWRDRHFIFVEDYPHATGKALISVVEVDEAGAPSVPAAVLEEPFHLSYPQVFARDGEIWMLPEASASHRLTLYRAERFPDRWTPEAVLVDGMAVSDATLLEQGGQLWLFATDRDGYGSTSDTLVVFHAPRLAGPWTLHRRNPILIDRRRARPGGAFIRAGTRILLPVQDGTTGYGGGLGISELLQLDDEHVLLSDPVPVGAAGDWPYPQIHTLNRAGRLEVIDGIAAVRKK